MNWDPLGKKTIASLSLRLEENQVTLQGAVERLERQHQLIDHLQAQTEEKLSETITTTLNRKLYQTGIWEELGISSSMASEIQLGRDGYQGNYKRADGSVMKFGTSKRIVDMHAEHCFGGGLEAPRGEDDDINKVLKEWWWYPPNQDALFGAVAQFKASASLLVDGALYFAIFEPGPGRPMLIRVMDPLEFPQTVTSPEDKTKVLYHQRVYKKRTFDPESGTYKTNDKRTTIYYKDIDTFDDESEWGDDPYEGSLNIAKDSRGNPIWVFRVALSQLATSDQYSGIMVPMMEWEEKIIKLAEDQATISAATAALMNRLYVKGGQRSVDAAVAFLGQSGDSPTTAPSNAGDINVFGDTSRLEVSRAGTGSSDTRQTVRMFQIPQVAIGGVALHFVGDPENANLATTTSMEAPILKHFLSYQALWTYVYLKMAKFALKHAGEVDLDEIDAINVPMPKLVVPDLLDRVNAVQIMGNNGWATEEQASRECFLALGVADVASEVQRAMEAYENQPIGAMPLAGPNPLPNMPGQANTPGQLSAPPNGFAGRPPKREAGKIKVGKIRTSESESQSETEPEGGSQ